MLDYGMVKHIELRAHDTITNLETALKHVHEPILKMRFKAIMLRKRGLDPQEIAQSVSLSLTGRCGDG